MRFSRNLSHLPRTFKPAMGDPPRAPDLVVDQVLPTFGALDRSIDWSLLQSEVTTGTAVQIFGPAVPTGLAWFIPYASCFHSDASQRRPQMGVRDSIKAPNVFIGVQNPTDNGNFEDNEHVSLAYPIYLPEGWQLTVEESNGNSVDLTLRYAFIEVEVGERLFMP